MADFLVNLSTKSTTNGNDFCKYTTKCVLIATKGLRMFQAIHKSYNLS